MKFFFVGYMGSGKSTLGKELSELKNIPFIDLDKYIEKKEEASISEIFQRKGEVYFRKKEMEYLDKLLLHKGDFVLSVGGGTPCFGNNMKKINQASEFVFYLQYHAKSLSERLLFQKKHRPLIAHLSNEELTEFIAKHLLERHPFYMQAKHIIKMDGLSKNESLQEILNRINKK